MKQETKGPTFLLLLVKIILFYLPVIYTLFSIFEFDEQGRYCANK